MKEQFYASCVTSCLIYGRETWTMKKEHERKLQATKMRMIRWMCGVSLRDRKSNVELRSQMGIEDINKSSMQKRKTQMVWACGKERGRRLGEEMFLRGGGRKEKGR